MTVIKLPGADRTIKAFTPRAAVAWPAPTGAPRWNRIAFAAAHVVADPRAAVDPWLEAAIDWDTTLAFRRHLWAHGFGVAEAMDTAQRGMGLDWPTSLELIRRSVREAQTIPGATVYSGAGTDHLPVGAICTIDDVIAAYEAQCDAIEAVGGQQSTRSVLHLSELFRLADAAGLLRDPELAVARMRTFLSVNGIEG